MKKYLKSLPIISLVAEATEFKKEQMTGSQHIYDYVMPFFKKDIQLWESSFLLLLNQSNSTIGIVKISQGGIAGTVVDPIIVAKYAIGSLAKAVVLCHNHPSGNLKPSVSDVDITKKIQNGLALFDIRLLDHIIFTENGYTSLCDEGLM